MNKTIKQLADELKVSKTAVRKYMDEEFRSNYVQTDSNGVITINADGCKLIAEIIKNNRKPIAETTENKVSENTITIPREVWEAINRQLDSQAKQISDQAEQITKLTSSLDNTTSSLQAAQALHAGTMKGKLIEAPKKHRWQFWKKDEEVQDIK